MLEKKSNYHSTIDVIHNPKFETGQYNYIKSLDLKLASTDDIKVSEVNKDGNSPDFDLEAEVREHPDFLFVKIFAIKANETNDNGDWFSTEELKKAYATFVGVPIFTNHQNTDVEKAKGKVVHSWYDDEKDGIMIIARIDAVAYPHLARSIREKYTLGTSMGTQVKYSICSICHNYAEKPNDYCGCIKERKGKVLTGSTKCIYKVHGTADKCPLCGCGKDEEKVNKYSDLDVHEKNYDLRFIENSLVVSPACHDCGITDIIDTTKFLKKVAEINAMLPGLLKAASTTPISCTNTSCTRLCNEQDSDIVMKALNQINIIANNIQEVEKYNELLNKTSNIKLDSLSKYAGAQEIKDLRTAIDLIGNVSKKMIDQKGQIDLDFLSEIIEALAKLQQTTDELEQQGFSRLPSLESTPGTETPTVPGTDVAGTTPAPLTPTVPGGVNPAVGTSKVNTGPTETGVGSVTGPMASVGKKWLKISKNKKIVLAPEFKKTHKVNFKGTR